MDAYFVAFGGGAGAGGAVEGDGGDFLGVGGEGEEWGEEEEEGGEGWEVHFFFLYSGCGGGILCEGWKMGVVRGIGWMVEWIELWRVWLSRRVLRVMGVLIG